MYVVFNYCLRFCIPIIVRAFIMFELLQNLGPRFAERSPGHGDHRHPGDLRKEFASVGNSMECRERPPKLVDVHTSAARFGTLVTSIDWPAGQPNSYVTTQPFQWTWSTWFSKVIIATWINLVTSTDHWTVVQRTIASTAASERCGWCQIRQSTIMLLRHAMMKQWVSWRQLIALEYHHEGVSLDATTSTSTPRRARVANGVHRSVTRCRQRQRNFALPTSWWISIRVPMALMGMIASIRFVGLVCDLPLSRLGLRNSDVSGNGARYCAPFAVWQSSPVHHRSRYQWQLALTPHGDNGRRQWLTSMVDDQRYASLDGRVIWDYTILAKVTRSDSGSRRCLETHDVLQRMTKHAVCLGLTL